MFCKYFPSRTTLFLCCSNWLWQRHITFLSCDFLCIGSPRFLSLVRRVWWLHVWCFDLFPCPRKTISWFYKSNRNWAPWLRSLAGGPGFSAQSLETYTHISRAGCASTVRGSRCNIRCLGTRGLVINPGWWTTGQCPHFFNPKDNLSEQDLRQVRGSKLQASGCLLQVLWAKDRVWYK